MSANAGLPDLLRRFVPTPHAFATVLHSGDVRFKTNDPALLAMFGDQAEQLITVLAWTSEGPWSWKLIRDHDVCQNGHEAYFLSSGNLSTVFLGTGTVAAIDWQRRELVGFVAEGVSAQQLLELLLALGEQDHPEVPL